MGTVKQSQGVERATETLDILGESAIWCGIDNVLYWVDIRAPALRRLDPATGQVTSWTVNDLCGAVMLTTDRRLVLSMRLGLFVFDPADESLQPFAAPEPESLNNRLNDSKCDRRGRLWIGTMRDYGLATTGSLYRIGADASCARMLSDITVPNALSWSLTTAPCISPIRRTGRSALTNSMPDEGRLGAMKIIEAGNASGQAGRRDGGCRRLHLERALPGRLRGAHHAARRVDRIIELPASQVTSCAFGGRDLRTLFITTARQKLTPEDLKSSPWPVRCSPCRSTSPDCPSRGSDCRRRGDGRPSPADRRR